MTDTLPDSDDDSRNGDPAARGAFDRLKAELIRAFAAPDGDYTALTAADVIARNRN